MCGIVGIVNMDRNEPVNAGLLREMTDTLVHRGPDDEGILLEGNVGLGHRRLSIIDLSPRGRQPFQNEDGTIFLVMNGEVYNYVEIAEALVAKGHRFHSDSDSEVVLHGYEEYGIDIVRQLRGMFAFAIYDGNEEKLFLARDRLGEKPLYYSFSNGRFAFASELKALLRIPDLDKTIDPRAIDHYLVLPYIPAPDTIFSSTKKVRLAHYLVLDRHGNVQERPYWSVDFTRKAKYRRVEEAAEDLRELLADTVRLEMRSDVPVVTLLSGGVDSSAITSMMVRNTDIPVHTYSVGYEAEGVEDPEFHRAREISKMFDTDHSEVVFADKDISRLGELLCLVDEPFNVFAVIYSYILLKEIRREGIKVALSGAGADEIFLGYSGYNAARRNFRRLAAYRKAAAFIPGCLLRGVGAGLDAAGLRKGTRFEKLERIKRASKRQLLASAYDASEMRGNLLSPEYRELGYDAAGLYLEALDHIDFDDFLDGRSYIDYMIYGHHGCALMNDITGMANSVEVRSPFLDHKIVEFSATLPYRFKVKDDVAVNNKHVLKKAMEGILPHDILYGKKMGFGYNIDFYAWMRGPWRKGCEHILLHDCLRECGIFDVDYIEKMWNRFLSERETEADRFLLWGLIAFDLWYSVWIDGKSGDRFADLFAL